MKTFYILKISVFFCVLCNINNLHAQTLPPAGWLYTQGNKIYISDGDGNQSNDKVFAGRGANIFDTRSCSAGIYFDDDENVQEAKRRIDMLVDDWGANFLRLCLQNSLATTVMEDQDYLDDIEEIVAYIGTKSGVYVLVSVWWDDTTDDMDWPTDETNQEWELIAGALAEYPHAMFGMVNEPRNNFNNDNTTNAQLMVRWNSCVSAIRAAETAAGSPAQHIITASGTGGWGRYMSYYVNNRVTAYGGTNIAYETHVYDPPNKWNGYWLDASASVPMIIGEFGPEPGYMTMDECQEMMELADERQISYAGWSFHMRCEPNMLVDNSNGGNGAGMDLVPTAWGELLRDHLLLMRSGIKINNLTVQPSSIFNDVNTNIQISATVTSEDYPLTSVTLDLSALGGGSNVSMSNSGDVYSYQFTVPAGTSAGNKSISITAVNSNSETETGAVTIKITDPNNVTPEINNFTVNPSSVYNDENTQITFSATVTDALNSSQTVTLNLTSIGGGASVATTKSGNVYSYTYTVPSGQSVGSKNITLTAVNAGGNSATDNVALNVRERVDNELVIYRDNETRITGTWVSTDRGTLNEITTGAFEGSEHYQYDYIVSGYWGNCGLQITMTDFTGYESMQLACRQSGSGEIFIRLKDSGGNYTDYLDLNGLSSTYGYVTIPVSSMIAASGDPDVDLTSIDLIQIDGGGGASASGVFNFDDITLVPPMTNKVFSVAPTSITLSALQGSQADITVTSNVDWTVSENADWLELSATSGNGDGTITVTTTQVHVQSPDRTASVTFRSAGLNDQVVQVTQEWEDVLEVQPSVESKINMYPNPAGSNMHLDVPEMANVEVMDLNGVSLIKKQKIMSSDIDISGLAKGIYLVRVEVGEDIVVRRLIKY